jgi:hypothetical protein
MMVRCFFKSAVLIVAANFGASSVWAKALRQRRRLEEGNSFSFNKFIPASVYYYRKMISSIC